ncbi:MAG: lipid A export permease/ATP-binding protein MsbA [Pontibacterium sp.]
MPSSSEQVKKSGWQAYGRLFSYVRPYWPHFCFGFIGFALYALSQTGFARWMETVVNTVGDGDYESRGYIAMAIIGLFVVRGLGTFISNYTIAYIARRVINQLRRELFNKLLVLPRSFYDGQSSGQVLSRITFNVEQVTGAASDAVRIILREGLTIIGLLGYLFYLNWKLTFILIAVAPLIGAVVSFAAKRLRRLSKEIQESIGDVSHVTSELIRGIDVVRIFGGTAREQERFETANERNRQQFMKLVVAQSINTPVVQLIVAAALAALVYAAMHPDLMASMNAGEFIAFITAAGMIAKPMRQVTEVNVIIQRGIAASESVFEFTDLDQETDEGTQKLAAKGDIKFENLTFAYGEDGKRALEDINLHIKAGESVALVGRSGSGKSTLVNLISRFYNRTSGELLMDDMSIDDVSLESLRSQISLVNQNVVLFEGTIAENIAYGALEDVSREAIEQAAKSAHVIEFAEQMDKGLDTWIGEGGVTLSGGQKQRVAIARALLKNAPILILDEATSALDTESERYIQDAMDAAMAGRTTLVIAHRLSTIENVDRILVMDKGQVIESGSHKALLSQEGAYAKLYRMQFTQASRSDNEQDTNS